MRNLLSSLLVTISTIIVAQNPNSLIDNFTTIEPGPTTIIQGEYNGPLANPTGQLDLEKYRRIFWVHGLTGDKNSWINAGSACQDFCGDYTFPARKVRSEFLEYGEEGTMGAAASQLHGQILNYCSIQQNDPDFEDCEKNIVIGHSQGGLVSRSILQNHFCHNNAPFEDLGFGGLVTVSSSNLGAQILNNAHIGDAMITELCASLIAGPVLEKSHNFIDKFDLILWAFDELKNKIVSAPVDALTEVFCEKIENALFYGLSSIKMPPITDEYHVGSEWIDELTAGCENDDMINGVKKLAFYSIEADEEIDPTTGTFYEPEGLIFRTLWYLIKSPNHPDYGYFGANNDFELFPLVQEIVEPYQAKVEEYKSDIEDREMKINFFHCNDFGILFVPTAPYFCVILVDAQEDAYEILDGYKSALNWFNHVDEKYKKYIGAVTYEKEEGCDCIRLGDEFGYTDEPYFTGPMIWNGIAYDECESIPEVRECFETHFEFVRKYEHSDGIVLASSQIGFPDLVHVPILLKNTSHMQARNNVALKEALNSMFAGDYDDFFRTEEK